MHVESGSTTNHLFSKKISHYIEVITAEFTVEPFVEGSPGPHVQAAIQIAEEAGLKVEIGPFGNSITGDPNIILPLISSMLSAAVNNGATRISLQVTQV